MNDEILKRVDLLAAKMSIGAGEVFGVLVAQAKIAGIQDAVWAVIMLCVFVACSVGMRVAFKSDKEASGSMFVSCLCVASVSVIFIALSVNGALTELLNPKYWALMEIAKVFK